MDRFIPLRFRALTATEQHEEVKWCNVFQEASFSLNRATGRCTGSVTWTDKLIQSMDSGFFRLLDANRYMELDGITAKHLYRFLAVAFAKTDVVIVDARQLATEHLGILNPPKYLVAADADAGAGVRAIDSHSGAGLLPGGVERGLADRAAPPSQLCV